MQVSGIGKPDASLVIEHRNSHHRTIRTEKRSRENMTCSTATYHEFLAVYNTWYIMVLFADRRRGADDVAWGLMALGPCRKPRGYLDASIRWRNSHHARYLRPTFCQSMSIPVLFLEFSPATSPTAQFFYHQHFHHE
jgi:hypothetical protein